MTLFIILRLVHVLSGAIWLGFAIFIPFLLVPAMAEAGPEAGGKVMGALQRAGLMTVMPIIAILTIISGGWLFWLVSGGDLHGFVMSPTGHTLTVGATSAIVAYIIGLTVSRPAMMKSAAIMQSLASVTNPEERQQKMAAAQKLRGRGVAALKVVAVLLVVAASAMAIARYWLV